MPSPISITCPHCSARLKLKDSSKLGQKLACPKCKKPFKAQEDAPDDDEFAGLISEAAEEEEEFEAPPIRRAASSKPSPARGKSRGKSSASKAPLIIGSVFGLLVLVGIGFAVMHFLGGKEPPPAPVAGPEAAPPPQGVAQPPAAPKSIDFAWLPSQSEMVIYLKPRDLLASEFAQWVIDAAGGRAQFQQGQEKMRQEVGIGFEDVETITIGIKSLGEIAAGAADMAPGGMPNPMAAAAGLSRLKDKEIVGVVRLKSPIDLTQNAQFKQMMEPASHGSVTYYRDKPSAGTGSSFVYAPSPTMLVISGREDVLKGLIDRQGKPEPRPELEIIDPGEHLALGFAVAPGLIPNQPGDASPFAAFGKVKSASIAFKATAGIELTVRQSCPDAAAAQEVQAATDSLVAMGQEKLSSLAGGVPVNLKELGTTLLTNVKTSRRDNLIETRSNLPASSRENLQAAPGEVMMAVLMGGLGGAGAGGGGAFGGSFTSSDGDSETMGEPVVVESLAGLPEGMTLKGRAGWARVQMFEQDGKTPQPRPLAFEIDLVGGPATKGVEFGKLHLTRVAAEPDQYLKMVEEPGTFGEAGPFKEFVGIKRGDLFGKHPEDGVRIALNFDRPVTIPTKFAAVEGNVTLKYAEVTKEVVVPKLLEQAGKSPADSDLKAAGFSVEIKKEEAERTMVVAFAPHAKVADLTLVGADGNPLQNAPFLLRLDFGGIPRYSCSLPAGSPLADMGAKIMLHTDVREITVPFKFENVTIAAPPDPAAIPTAPWKLSSSKKAKLPDGMFVEGRLKWENLTSFDNKQPPMPEVHLSVDVTGEPALKVISAGFTKIETAETDIKRNLTPKTGFSFGGDRSKQFVKIERNPLLGRHPPDGLQLDFGFEPSPVSFARVTYVAGSFKLLVASEQKKTVLDKLPSRVGKGATTPELRGAGIELKLAKEFDNLTVKITKGNPYALGDAKLIRESSEGDFEVPTMQFDPAEKSGSLYLGEKKLKANDSLEFTVYSGIEEIEVPFEFEDLIVPPQPKAGN